MRDMKHKILLFSPFFIALFVHLSKLKLHRFQVCTFRNIHIISENNISSIPLHVRCCFISKTYTLHPASKMTIWGTSQSCRRFLLVGKGLFVTLKISAPSQLASIALDLTFFSFTSSFASSALDLILSLSHYHLHVEILFSEPQELWC